MNGDDVLPYRYTLDTYDTPGDHIDRPRAPFHFNS
jgi:hypothetical protein